MEEKVEEKKKRKMKRGKKIEFYIWKLEKRE